MDLRFGSGRGISLFHAAGSAAAGVTGYARNLDDGGVEVLAYGEAEQVEKLIAWLKAGAAQRAG